MIKQHTPVNMLKKKGRTSLIAILRKQGSQFDSHIPIALAIEDTDTHTFKEQIQIRIVAYILFHIYSVLAVCKVLLYSGKFLVKDGFFMKIMHPITNVQNELSFIPAILVSKKGLLTFPYQINDMAFLSTGKLHTTDDGGKVKG